MSNAPEKIKAEFERLDIVRRYEELLRIGENPGKEVAQKRGIEFESLLSDLFEAHGVLLRRSYRTTDNGSEQIDGAIEVLGRPTLLEVKWVESGLAASDLFAFLGKIEGKFVGAIGMFISHVTLGANFINALRTGRRQSVIVVHGPNEMRDIFGPTFPLNDYLRATVHHLSLDNGSHYSTEKFLATRKQSEIADAASNEGKKGTLAEILLALKNAGAADALKIAAGKNVEEITDWMISLYPKILQNSNLGSSFRTETDHFLRGMIKDLPAKELPLDQKFFDDQFPNLILDTAYGALIRMYAKRMQFLSQGRQDRVERLLLSSWEKHIGTYDYENILAVVTDAFWPYLSADCKRKIYRWYISFVNSQRYSSYPQVTVARRRLKEAGEEQIKADALYDMLFLEFCRATDADLDITRKWLERSMEGLSSYFDPKQISAILARAEENAMKEKTVL